MTIEKTLRAASSLHAGLMQITRRPVSLGRPAVPVGVKLLFAAAVASLDLKVFANLREIDLVLPPKRQVTSHLVPATTNLWAPPLAGR